MLIFASEDIGTADPAALQQAVAADQAFARLGMPEGIFALAQCCHYLACAPKSNASYRSFTRAKQDIDASGALPVPLKLRNAPTKLMEGLGYGGGYRYPHNFEGHYVAEQYLPDALRTEKIVSLSANGLEKTLAERLRALRDERDATGE